MIELHTPSLLFPAISLLMLAYTNRYLALASLIRKLHSDYMQGHEHTVRAQIDNLRMRMILIRQMQVFGLLSLLICLSSTICLLFAWKVAGTILFGTAVLLMIASLVQCLREVLTSGGALDILLQQIETVESQRENSRDAQLNDRH